MGAVYEAIDERLERTVAIKTIALGASQEADAEFRARFVREAKSAARLNHPGIVTIYESGESNGVAYIAMEFLRGQSLRTLLDAGERFTPTQVVEFGIAAAEALEFAHEHGVVHRDIKPSNLVKLGTGTVKITDFGVAHYVNDDLTQVGAVIGTPKYMSPEQVNSERIDGRSDLFSLGVVLYELATGQAPFVGSSIASIMFQVINQKPTNPMLIEPQVTPALAWVIGRCIAKRPADRYPSGRALAEDLRRLSELKVPNGALQIIYSTAKEPGEARATSGDEATIRLNPEPGVVRRPTRVQLGVAIALALVVVAALTTLWRGGFRHAANGAEATTLATPASSPASALPVHTNAMKVQATEQVSEPAKENSAGTTTQKRAAAGSSAATATAPKNSRRDNVAEAPRVEERDLANQSTLERLGTQLKSATQKFRDCLSTGKCEPKQEKDPAFTAGG